MITFIFLSCVFIAYDKPNENDCNINILVLIGGKDTIIIRDTIQSVGHKGIRRST